MNFYLSKYDIIQKMFTFVTGEENGKSYSKYYRKVWTKF